MLSRFATRRLRLSRISTAARRLENQEDTVERVIIMGAVRTTRDDDAVDNDVGLCIASCSAPYELALLFPSTGWT